ncbi:MAG: aminoacyl-tRNA hydrolase [Planctomycetaceae bacterium]
MKLVIGLGNPGKKYAGTRHNVGFDLIAELATRGAAPRPRSRFEAEIAEATLAGQRVLLAAPQTYMNASGISARQIVDFYQLATSDLLVVCDDINLPLGKLRLRKTGSAGGQKGLADILRHLGTEAVPRLRIGIARPPEGRTSTDHVLDRFSKPERAEIEAAVQRAADAIELWLTSGFDAAMNRFNAAESKEDEPG